MPISLARVVLVAAALIGVAGASVPAAAQSSERWDICVRQHVADTQTAAQPLGVAPAEAELMIRDIAASIGLDATLITVLPCHRIARAMSIYTDGVTGLPAGGQVPAGEYILYNEQWVREVLGNDRVQAEALLGHELGHLVNRDFLAPRNLLARAQLEADADKFAGCAVARGRGGGDWAALENLFTRLRAEQGGLYPSRAQSLAAALQGYEACRRTSPPPPTGASTEGERLLAAAAVGDLAGVMRYLTPMTFQARATEGLNALMISADSCQMAVARYILSVAGPMGLDVNATNEWGDTALQIARGTDSDLRALGVVRPRCAAIVPDLIAAGGR